MMKRPLRSLFASIFALSFIMPALSEAAPSHRCSVETNQLFYFMISVDDALDKVQQDFIEHYSRDKSLKLSLQGLVDTNRALHNNMGRQAMKGQSASYSYSTLTDLHDAALNYYNLAANRMRSNHEHLQNAYELQWLIQEARNEFDAQCRDNRKSREDWDVQWDQRPDYASVVNMINHAMAEEAVHQMAAHQAMMHQMLAGYQGKPHVQAEERPVPARPQPVILEPMDDATFKMLKKQLQEAAFDKDKQSIIVAAAAHNYFTVTQLRDLMTAEKFDSAKLIYAEAVFPRLVDKSNWFILLKAMTFDSYKQKLQEIANRNI